MFPEKLRFLREQKSLTQENLGKMFSLSKQTISAYESGIASPPIETVVLFADFFNVSTDYLLGRQTETVEEEGVFYGLDDTERQAIREQAEFYRYRKQLPEDKQGNLPGSTNEGKSKKKTKLEKAR